MDRREREKKGRERWSSTAESCAKRCRGRKSDPPDRKGATADLGGGRGRRRASELRLPPPGTKNRGSRDKPYHVAACISPWPRGGQRPLPDLPWRSTDASSSSQASSLPLIPEASQRRPATGDEGSSATSTAPARKREVVRVHIGLRVSPFSPRPKAPKEGLPPRFAFAQPVIPLLLVEGAKLVLGRAPRTSGDVPELLKDQTVHDVQFHDSPPPLNHHARRRIPPTTSKGPHGLGDVCGSPHRSLRMFTSASSAASATQGFTSV